jgi:putative hemolysin
MENQKIHFQQTTVDFSLDPNSGLVLSTHCAQKPCLAKMNLQKISFKKYLREKTGSENPSSYFCKILEGTVVLGKTPQGNEISYCKFADGSLIEGGSLIKSAKENDKKSNYGRKGPISTERIGKAISASESTNFP